MLNLNVNISIDTNNNNNLLSSKNFNLDENSFSKVFEEANKSFEATKEKISENQEEYAKSKENFVENNEEEAKENKNESKKETENEEITHQVSLEEILLNYKTNSINENASQKNQESADKASQLREKAELLLHQKEQVAVMNANLMKTIQAAKAENATQNPIKTQGQLLANTDNKFNEVFVKNEALLNMQNLPTNIKVDSAQTSSLADALSELKVEVTAVKSDLSAQTDSKSFDFNSSSFNNLDSHITKLNLNKTVDFAKVMGQKVMQEQQILNQVKEGTTQLAKGSSQVNIVLRPETLGRINVQISSVAGSLSAQFTAQNQQAADALTKNIEILRQNLLEQGLKITEISVKVQDTNHSEAFSDNRNFDDGDKLNAFKENYSNNKNSYKANTKENVSERAYAENIDTEDESSEISENNEEINNNKDLGIYNNMGRKV